MSDNNLAIQIINLEVEFKIGKSTLKALQGLNLSVKKGTIFGFLGPNGAGKTTTINVLLGFVLPSAGTAKIFDQDVRFAIARRKIGYMSEHPDTYRFLTGYEAVYFAGRMFDIPKKTVKERANFLLEKVGLKDAAKRRVATYSRGMLQRLGLAQALINDPELLILDEPTSGFDPLGRIAIRKILSELREAGKTIFFSSHELSEVEKICDTIGIISQGRLIATGTVDELTKGASNLEEFFVKLLL